MSYGMSVSNEFENQIAYVTLLEFTNATETCTAIIKLMLYLKYR